jgi:hypothetical protein
MQHQRESSVSPHPAPSIAFKRAYSPFRLNINHLPDDNLRVFLRISHQNLFLFTLTNRVFKLVISQEIRPQSRLLVQRRDLSREEFDWPEQENFRVNSKP